VSLAYPRGLVPDLSSRQCRASTLINSNLLSTTSSSSCHDGLDRIQGQGREGEEARRRQDRRLPALRRVPLAQLGQPRTSSASCPSPFLSPPADFRPPIPAGPPRSAQAASTLSAPSPSTRTAPASLWATSRAHCASTLPRMARYPTARRPSLRLATARIEATSRVSRGTRATPTSSSLGARARVATASWPCGTSRLRPRRSQHSACPATCCTSRSTPMAGTSQPCARGRSAMSSSSTTSRTGPGSSATMCRSMAEGSLAARKWVWDAGPR
jgi:hypothetical protein